MHDFHFLRPLMLWLMVPLVCFFILLLRQREQQSPWADVIDEHLLATLMDVQEIRQNIWPLLALFGVGLMMIVSMAGPAWKRLPVPVFSELKPRVILLSLDDAMQQNDVSPSRLARARFILDDLLKLQKEGQTALVVYTKVPFVVSPMTKDSNTIIKLLPMLTPDVVPVDGNDLPLAMEEAAKLIEQAGFLTGQILVLTGTKPSSEANAMAARLMARGIESSIMPITSQTNQSGFATFAKAGNGEYLPMNASEQVLQSWLKRAHTLDYQQSQYEDIPVWQDEGRWFLIPALLMLLPFFRRGFAEGAGL